MSCFHAQGYVVVSEGAYTPFDSISVAREVETQQQQFEFQRVI